MALKWFYNLIDCLERFDYEQNINFFKSIFNRKINENIYHRFRNISNELKFLCNSDLIKNEKQSSDEISYQNNLNQILSRDSSINSFFTKNEKSVSFSTTRFPVSKSNTRIPEESLIKIFKS